MRLFHFLHRWSLWRDVERGVLLKAGTRQAVGDYIVQMRACELCNKVQLRRAVTR